MCDSTAKSSINENKISTLGIHHLGLTVIDVKQTAAFFIEQLNFSQVGEKPHYPAIFVSDGTVMITLWQVNDKDNMTAFDRKNNIGLHHVALKVANVDHLQHLYQKLSLLDTVTIEFAPEPLEDLPIHHMMCLIPGGIRLELISA